MSIIFITGATGFIGGSVALRLLEQGMRVRGLVRHADDAISLAAQGIEPVMGDLDDTQMLRREAQASDGVIHTASADHPASAQALVDGLLGSGKPLLHTSGSSIVADDARGAHANATVFNEDMPLVVGEAKQARHAIDKLVLQAANQGVRSAVICPGLIYGTGHGLRKTSVQVPLLVRHAQQCGQVQIVGPGHNVWSNVHLDDVVELFVLALTKAPAGAFYFAENGQASFAEVGQAIAQRLGLGPVQSLSPDAAACMWGVMRAWYSLGSNSRIQARRARRELGWSPRHDSLIEWILHEMPLDPA